MSKVYVVFPEVNIYRTLEDAQDNLSKNGYIEEKEVICKRPIHSIRNDVVVDIEELRALKEYNDSYFLDKLLANYEKVLKNTETMLDRYSVILEKLSKL